MKQPYALIHRSCPHVQGQYIISEELKKVILEATKPSDIPEAERKKIYNAIARGCETQKFPPAVIAKWCQTRDNWQTKFFFLQDDLPAAQLSAQCKQFNVERNGSSNYFGEKHNSA